MHGRAGDALTFAKPTTPACAASVADVAPEAAQDVRPQEVSGSYNRIYRAEVLAIRQGRSRPRLVFDAEFQ